ncbi:TadE/TadG family type IV pilus assembly protein [Sphingomonas abietis]|uniref:Tad domain-containing protein n=1 Tax=Sphingomonas abietis TaxID=3012344 RepID=A0ABY7NIA3_9SPHN|nr:TadE/TadG family type IV pilus assembly protein [Sphingomonas abietis]WBO21251.1 Tad domain-containing protein [Sphingomonas abietis]
MRSQRIGNVFTLFARMMRDKGGNVLMIAAAAMIPLTGMVGGAIDLSRLYLVKVRLQHACDAGALAGRRSMAGGAWGADDLSVANQFFTGNFLNGAYGTGTVTTAFTQPTGSTTVHGVASTTVPMTLMRVFAIPTKTVSVSCDSDMQMPNTDVMFVLDNTGSMSCDPNGNSCYSGSTSKIYGLKNAVKCFYEVLAQLKTNGSCTSTITNAGIANGTQLRFGFVPYTTNVNLKSLLLPSNYYATSWPYQSREVYQYWGNWSNTNISCNNVPQNTSTTQYQKVTTNNYGWGGGTSCTVQSRTLSNEWHYGQVNLNLSGFSPSSSSVSLPIGNNYTNTSVTWDGCTEEAAATTDINSMADGQLAPALPDAIYLRASGTGSLSSNSMTTSDQYTTSNYYNSVRANFYFCPTAAQKLQTWSTSTFDNYVDSLVASGNTYHDVGMLWGGRLLSPEGIYKTDNTTTATGGQIQRHMIFMTDGDAQSFACDYQQFGIAWWDRRTDSNVGSASNCAGVNSTLSNDINTRLAALCTSVKAEPNTILWVISFGGTGIASDTKQRLQTCATDSSHYFDATSNASLQTAFQTIAAKIAQLRITK